MPLRHKDTSSAYAAATGVCILGPGSSGQSKSNTCVDVTAAGCHRQRTQPTDNAALVDMQQTAMLAALTYIHTYTCIVHLLWSPVDRLHQTAAAAGVAAAVRYTRSPGAPSAADNAVRIVLPLSQAVPVMSDLLALCNP